MAKVLVTGATGFIGSHLAERLHADGHEVRCLVRETSNLRWIEHLEWEKVVGSVTDRASLDAAVDGVDRVYHVAGVIAAFTREPFYDVNHTGTRNLLDACLEVSPNIERFINVASLAVVGPGKDGTPVDESTPCNPITIYGHSKMLGENEVFKESDRLPVTSIRPSAVYGPRDNGIYEFFKTVNARLRPYIMPRKWLSLIHSDDLVDAIVLAGDHPDAIDHAFFAANNEIYDWDQVGLACAAGLKKRTFRLSVPDAVLFMAAEASTVFSKLTGKPNIFDKKKAFEASQRYWICSNKKLRSRLGWEAKVEMERGFRETAQWYLDNGWL